MRAVLSSLLLLSSLSGPAAAAVGGELSATADEIEIVVAERAPKTVRFAAEEMRRLLKRSFGKEIPLAAAPSEGKTSLVLGDNVWSREAGIDVARLARDEFRVKADAARRRVCIVGRDDPKADIEELLVRGGKADLKFEHATLFGVYDFLERFAGIRFYFPTELGTCVPSLSRLVVPPTDLASAPYFQARHYYINGDGEWPSVLDADYGGKMSGKNLSWVRLRMQTKRITPCHGQNSFRYTERFRETHPEYLQLRKDGMRATETAPKGDARVWRYGHWCHTSPIWDVLHDDVLARMRAGEEYVDIAPQDGFQRCHCEKCKAAYTESHPDSYATELIWGNVVRLAKRLIDEKAGGLLVMSAYAPYQRIPDFDIPTNVVVDVSENGPWMLYQPELDARQDRHFRAWHEKTGVRNIFWHYATKWSGFDIPDVPQSTPRAVAAFYNRIAPISLGGFHESSSDRALYNYLNYYVYSKVAWDGHVDVEAVLEEHDRLMFGKAAKPMRAFLESVEERWMKGIAGRPDAVGMNSLGPIFLGPSQLELWSRIYSPKLVARWRELFKRASSSVPSGSLEARRIALIRRVFFEPLEQKAAAYVKTLSVSAELAERQKRPEAANLIGNGVFADGAGWKLSAQSGEATVDPSAGVVAPGALRLLSNDLSPTGAFLRAYATYRFEGERRLRPGQTYRLSFFVKLDHVRPYNFGGGVDVVVRYAGDDHSHANPCLAGSSDWVHQQFVFTVPADAKDVSCFVRPRLLLASGTAWFDDFRLEPVP